MDFNSTYKWHGNSILVMGGIINLGGLYTFITGLDLKSTMLVFMIVFLVIINALSTLKCQKWTERKLKAILWNILLNRIIYSFRFINFPSYHHYKRRSYVYVVIKRALRILSSTVEYVFANHVQIMFQKYLYFFLYSYNLWIIRRIKCGCRWWN